MASAGTAIITDIGMMKQLTIIGRKAVTIHVDHYARSVTGTARARNVSTVIISIAHTKIVDFCVHKDAFHVYPSPTAQSVNRASMGTTVLNIVEKDVIIQRAKKRRVFVIAQKTTLGLDASSVNSEDTA